LSVCGGGGGDATDDVVVFGISIFSVCCAFFVLMLGSVKTVNEVLFWIVLLVLSVRACFDSAVFFSASFFAAFSAFFFSAFAARCFAVFSAFLFAVLVVLCFAVVASFFFVAVSVSFFVASCFF